jgi:hypothetical protein
MTLHSAANADAAPDLIQPVIGYREWLLIGDEILSPLARKPWGAEPMRAECLPECRGARGLWRPASVHSGPAPDPRCVCGIYAFFTPPRRRGRDRLALVRGAVVLWGRIELHRRGMRAEYARVVALAHPPSRRPSEAVTRVAERLEVAAVPARDLPAVALEHGRPVEASLIPS